MHKNWVLKGYDQSVNLPCTVDEDNNALENSLVELFVTPLKIYIVQHSIHISKHTSKQF